MTTMEEVPMTTPKTVSTVRNFLRFKLLMAKRNKSTTFI